MSYQSELATASEVLVISDLSDPKSTTLTLQDFDIAGEMVLPFFLDDDEFKRQISGSGFEDKGVWIKVHVLADLIRGDEIFLLNPGSANPQRFLGTDLQRLWKRVN